MGVPSPEKRRLLEYLRQRLKILQFEVKGYKLTSSTLQLPLEVVQVLGSQDSEINQSLRASWKLLTTAADEELDKREQAVGDGIASLKKNHLAGLKHFGYGLTDNAKAQFEKAWQEFETKEVAEHKKAVEKSVAQIVENSKKLLRKLLCERLKDSPVAFPSQKTLHRGPQQDEKDEYIEWLIQRVKWPTPQKARENIVVKLRYYDVTEELLNDPEFVEVLEKVYRCKLEDLLREEEGEQQPMVLSMPVSGWVN